MNAHQRKTTLIGAALFAATAGVLAYAQTLNGSATAAPSPANPPAITASPPAQNERPVVEAVFVLDTTGSMGGLIQAAKDKIWSIASTMASPPPNRHLRISMGLVAYRDRGDDYVTQVVDLTPDSTRCMPPCSSPGQRRWRRSRKRQPGALRSGRCHLLGSEPRMPIALFFLVMTRRRTWTIRTMSYTRALRWPSSAASASPSSAAMAGDAAAMAADRATR